MLRTRVITALILLAVFVAVLAVDSYVVFALAAAVFFAAAAWECYRLFDNKTPVIGAAIWTAAYLFLVARSAFLDSALLFWICALAWGLRLAPSLAFGLPDVRALGNRLLTGLYGIAILGCFAAILVLYQVSAIYLFSVMAIVWVADIGAYFAGKAFGKRKLAPTISPGKSWEGALGGWGAVLVLSSLTTLHPLFSGTFAPQLLARFGWPGFLAAMTLLVAASVVGDLFESQLKRRVGMKDSSNLLPGHGGVLDRIDALIPALPIAVLLGSRF